MRHRSLFKAVMMGFALTGGLAASSAQDAPLIKEGSEALAKLSGFAGDYVIVGARRASDVSAPLQPGLELPIGQSIRFGVGMIEMAGASCDDWSVIPTGEPGVPLNDPNLADLTLGPADSPATRGDQQEHAGYRVVCEGEEVFTFHKVDDRVLVMPFANSSVNLILEKPLTRLQVRTYQLRLKSMKFYSGSLTGTLDEATLRASRRWYEERARPAADEPIPARPAITENLLDTLKIVQGP